MLEKVNLKKIMMKEEYKAIAGQLKPRLSALQQQMKEAKVPVIILFEGWSAAGKGSKISDVILNLDPRGFKVYSTVDPDETEARHPFLWRFWQKLPIAGEFSIFDRSWYQEVSTARLENALPKKELARRIEEINHFERTLTDNGYLIIKFFLHISQKEQKKRLSALEESKATRWRVTKTDWKRNRRYDDLYQIYDEMLEQTDTPCAPWRVIASEDRNVAMADIYQTLVKEIGRAIAQRLPGRHPRQPLSIGGDAKTLRHRPQPHPGAHHLQGRAEEVPSQAEKAARAPLQGADPGHRRLRGVGRGRQGGQHQAGGRRPRPPRVRGGPHRRPLQRGVGPPLPLAVLDPAAQAGAHHHL